MSSAMVESQAVLSRVRSQIKFEADIPTTSTISSPEPADTAKLSAHQSPDDKVRGQAGTVPPSSNLIGLRPGLQVWPPQARAFLDGSRPAERGE
jgi:hypothetical protein